MQAKIIESLDQYTIITKYGFRYVVRPIDRGTSGHPNANFMGSTMALRGVMKAGETLLKFIKRDRLKDLRPMSKSI